MLLAMLASAGAGAAAQSASPGDVLGAVVLSRHGVRAPLRDPSPLAPSHAWPVWPVAAYGELTTKGEDLARAMGAYYRDAYALDGDCTRSRARVAVVADATQRTLRTAEGLLAGLAPQCGIRIARAALFAQAGPPPAPAASVLAPYASEIKELRAFLGCCALDRNPLAVASEAAEIFELEYAQGMTVAWGYGGDDPRRLIYRAIALHVFDYALNERAAGVARARGGALLREMAARLAPSQWTFFIGHDTSQANVAGLLDLHWTMESYHRDDMPPLGALALELYRCNLGEPCVRGRYLAQSLRFMHEPAKYKDVEIVEASVPIPRCARPCGLSAFRRLIARST